jgi:hypothetical protein
MINVYLVNIKYYDLVNINYYNLVNSNYYNRYRIKYYNLVNNNKLHIQLILSREESEEAPIQLENAKQANSVFRQVLPPINKTS